MYETTNQVYLITSPQPTRSIGEHHKWGRTLLSDFLSFHTRFFSAVWKLNGKVNKNYTVITGIVSHIVHSLHFIQRLTARVEMRSRPT